MNKKAKFLFSYFLKPLLNKMSQNYPDIDENFSQN